MSRRRLTQVWLLTGLIGVGLMACVVAWAGLDDLAAAVSEAGWSAAWLIPWFVVPLVFATWSWLLLFPRGGGPGVARGLTASWAGLSMNWLLPVAQIGGELAKAEMAARGGVSGVVCLATVVGDKTVQIATQVLFACVGAVLLVLLATGAEAGRALGAAAAGCAVLTVLTWFFYRAQRRGMVGRAGRLAKKVTTLARGEGLAADAEAVDREVASMYGRRWRLAGAFVARLAFRLAMVFETWLVLKLLNQPAGLGRAIAIESLGQAVRAGSFLIPAGLGAQEGGYAGLAAAVGLTPEVGLTISLCKRLRELAVGLPGLLVWQLSSGWRWTRVGEDQAGPASEREPGSASDDAAAEAAG